jgi:hypothetical protein
MLFLGGDGRAAEGFADSFEAFSVVGGDAPRQMKTVAAFGVGEDFPAGQSFTGRAPVVGTRGSAPSAWGWVAGGWARRREGLSQRSEIEAERLLAIFILLHLARASMVVKPAVNATLYCV